MLTISASRFERVKQKGACISVSPFFVIGKYRVRFKVPFNYHFFFSQKAQIKTNIHNAIVQPPKRLTKKIKNVAVEFLPDAIVKRICEHCHQEFEAKTTTTRFCSLKCSNRNYKKRTSELKIQQAKMEFIENIAAYKFAGNGYNIQNKFRGNGIFACFKFAGERK